MEIIGFKTGWNYITSYDLQLSSMLGVFFVLSNIAKPFKFHSNFFNTFTVQYETGSFNTFLFWHCKNIRVDISQTLILHRKILIHNTGTYYEIRAAIKVY